MPGCELRDLDYVVFYDKPFLKFERLLETYLAYAPRGFASYLKAMPVWLGEKLFQSKLLIEESQALSTPASTMRQAAVHRASPIARRQRVLSLAVRGGADAHHWMASASGRTTAVALGNGNRSTLSRRSTSPTASVCSIRRSPTYIGFRVNSGEYKLMGLAPYGEPRFRNLIRDHLIDLKDDGSFRLDMCYFNYCTGLTMTNDKFDQAVRHDRCAPEDAPLTQAHMDIAASIQAVPRMPLSR